METKMEAEMRNQTVRTMMMAVTAKATIKGMKMSAKVEKRWPHKYNPDFCQVMVQLGRCTLVSPGQRPTNLTAYLPKRPSVLKLQHIAFSKGIRMGPLLLSAVCPPNLLFHTPTTHLSLKPSIHVPHPSPLLALAPNASWTVLSGSLGQALPLLRR
jgi:hypothetical protein